MRMQDSKSAQHRIATLYPNESGRVDSEAATRLSSLMVTARTEREEPIAWAVVCFDQISGFPSRGEQRTVNVMR